MHPYQGLESHIQNALTGFFIRKEIISSREIIKFNMVNATLIRRGHARDSAIAAQADASENIVLCTERDTQRLTEATLPKLVKRYKNVFRKTNTVSSTASLQIGESLQNFKSMLGADRVAINAAVALHRENIIGVMKLSKVKSVTKLLARLTIWKHMRYAFDGIIIPWVVADSVSTIVNFKTLSKRLGPLREKAVFHELLVKINEFMIVNIFLSYVSAVPGWISLVGLAGMAISWLVSQVVLVDGDFINDFDTVDAMIPGGSRGSESETAQVFADRLVRTGLQGDALVDAVHDWLDKHEDEDKDDAIAAMLTRLNTVLDDGDGDGDDQADQYDRYVAFQILMTPLHARMALYVPVDADTLMVQYDKSALQKFYKNVSQRPIACLVADAVDQGTAANDLHDDMCAVFSCDGTFGAATLNKQLQMLHWNIRIRRLFADHDVSTWSGLALDDVLDAADARTDDVDVVATTFQQSCLVTCYGELVALLLDNHFFMPARDGEENETVFTNSYTMLDALCDIDVLYVSVLAWKLLTMKQAYPEVYEKVDTSIKTLVANVVALDAPALTWDDLRDRLATRYATRPRAATLAGALSAVDDAEGAVDNHWPRGAAASSWGFL